MPLKELTPDNSFTVELKPKLTLETFYPLTPFPKVPLSVILNKELETEEFSPKLLELTVPSLDTPKMEPEPELDYLLEPEKPSPETVDVLLESVPEEEEPINPS